MANKYKVADAARKVAPGGKQPPTPPVTEEEKPVARTDDNPLEGMIEKKPESKACGFYLSVEATDKLEQLAKKNKCSKSKALDALLRSLP